MNDLNLQLRNDDLINIEIFMQKTSILLSSEKGFLSAASGNSLRLLIYREKEY